MTKRDLTDDEKKIIKNQQDACPVVKFLRTKDQMNFTVGDYLIKVHKRFKDGVADEFYWEPETISHVSSQPKRFICIHEDEYGIKYIKPLTSMGKELPNVIQLTECNDWIRYEVDPEFAEHIILSDEEGFDFSEKRKQDKARRDAITKKNTKISEKLRTVEQADALFASLKPGDKIWFGYTVPSTAESTPWTVVAINKKAASSYYGNTRKETYEITCQQDYANAPGGKFTRQWTSESFTGHVIMRTEPYKYETV